MTRSAPRPAGRAVLALDTSTDVCALALLCIRDPETSDGGAPILTLAEVTVKAGRSHTRMLLSLADQLLSATGLGVSDIEAVVVGTGPGTFTGVRMGVAAGRALALSRNIPVVGVSTLAALAADAASAVDSVAHEGIDCLVPVVDARRGQLFAGVYRRISGDHDPSRGPWVREQAYSAVEPEALVRSMEPGSLERALLVGDPDLVGDMPLPVYPRLVAAGSLLRGQGLLEEPDLRLGGSRLLPWLRGRWAEESDTPIDPGAPGSPEAVRPLYVRSPDADVHITRMRDPWAR